MPSSDSMRQSSSQADRWFMNHQHSKPLVIPHLQLTAFSLNCYRWYFGCLSFQHHHCPFLHLHLYQWRKNKLAKFGVPWFPQETQTVYRWHWIQFPTQSLSLILNQLHISSVRSSSHWPKLLYDFLNYQPGQKTHLFSNNLALSFSLFYLANDLLQLPLLPKIPHPLIDYR